MARFHIKKNSYRISGYNGIQNGQSRVQIYCLEFEFPILKFTTHFINKRY